MGTVSHSVHVAIRGLTSVGEQPSNRAKERRATGLVTVQVPEVLACHIPPPPPKTGACGENRLVGGSTESRRVSELRVSGFAGSELFTSGESVGLTTSE